MQRQTDVHDRVMRVTDFQGNRLETPTPKKLYAVLSPAVNQISNSIGKIVSLHADEEKAQRANRKVNGISVRLNRELPLGTAVFPTDVFNAKRQAANDAKSGQLFQRVWGQR
jgi:hypothetical protein